MATGTDLSPDAARRLRLRTQGLLLPDDGPGPSPVDVVRRMVALQGQDLPAVLRAIAVRSRPGTTIEDVRAAFDAGELVRGWTQRGTLFATTPGDLAALLSLTAERVHRTGQRQRDDEGLSEAVVAHAEAVTREALAASGNDRGITRAAMVDLWQQAGIPVQGQRGYHLIGTLAVQGVLHWAGFAGAQQLMVATPGAGAVPPEDPDAALRRIARSYFASRGPATVDDFGWWLGLPKTPVRAAVAALREAEPDVVVEVVVDGKVMLVDRVPDASELTKTTDVVLVPGFDEIVMAYQDRVLVADAEAMGLVVPFVNGIFRPAVLVDGRLIGTWRRAPKRDEEPYELVPGVSARTRKSVEAALAAWPHG